MEKPKQRQQKHHQRSRFSRPKRNRISQPRRKSKKMKKWKPMKQKMIHRNQIPVLRVKKSRNHIRFSAKQKIRLGTNQMVHYMIRVKPIIIPSRIVSGNMVKSKKNQIQTEKRTTSCQMHYITSKLTLTLLFVLSFKDSIFGFSPYIRSDREQFKPFAYD